MTEVTVVPERNQVDPYVGINKYREIPFTVIMLQGDAPAYHRQGFARYAFMRWCNRCDRTFLLCPCPDPHSDIEMVSIQIPEDYQYAREEG